MAKPKPNLKLRLLRHMKLGKIYKQSDLWHLGEGCHTCGAGSTSVTTTIQALIVTGKLRYTQGLGVEKCPR